MRNVIALALLLPILVSPAFGHGGSFRGPNGGVPPGLRPPTDPEPPPPPPTDPGTPGDPTTPRDGGQPTTPNDGGQQTPPNAPPPTPPPGPNPGQKRSTSPTLTYESWRFWWGYNNDDILNLKSHIYGDGPSSSSPRYFLQRLDERNRAHPKRPTMRAIVERVMPALQRSLDRPGDNEDIHGGALVALGKIGTIDDLPLFEAAAHNRHRTKTKQKIDFGYQAVESAVLAMGLLPNLDERGKADVRRALLAILDDDSMRSRERAWAAVCLGLQQDTGAVQQLWERLDDEYKGQDQYNVPAGILCGLGLIGDESIRKPLEELVVSGRVGSREFDDRIRGFGAYALGKIASPKSLPVLQKVLKSRRFGRILKRSVVIACGPCAAAGEPAEKDETVGALRRYLNNSGGDLSGENFAIIALSQIGTDDAIRTLIKLTDNGKYNQRPYAALGLGTHVWYTERAKERKEGEGMDPALLAKIRETLAEMSEKYKDNDTKAAMLLARGLCKDKAAIEPCVKIVSRNGDAVLRGFCCVTLGLIGESSENVKDALKGALAERKSVDLRRDAATALGLLRDASTVKLLLEELKRAKSFAVQGQLITAIGTIGDHTAIDPLIEILDNTNRPAAARAMAAVGLGMIGDLLPLSRLSRLSKNYNYRATVADIDELLYIL